MNAHNDICRLDYLVGTLATAYKGVITSLVLKDFCMSEDRSVTMLTGTVLAMPDGDYEASLNRSGVELARGRMTAGRISISTENVRIAGARNLQIDILQSGRHIGTFLLRRQDDDGVYSPAVELSEELSGFDPARLTIPLRGKAGLLRKAEEIVSDILSAKKDWAALSEKLQGFALDIFWSAPEVFYGAYEILARFMIRSAERSGAGPSRKPITNYFDLLELPLEHERDRDRLENAAAIWLMLLSRSQIDLAFPSRACAAVLRELRSRFPDLDTNAVLFRLIESLERKNASAAVLDDDMVARVQGLVPVDVYGFLSRCGETGRKQRERRLADARQRLEQGNAAGALDTIENMDVDPLDDQRVMAAFFDAAERASTDQSAGMFADSSIQLFSLADKLTPQALETLRAGLTGLIGRMGATGRPDLCGLLLSRIGDLPPVFRDRIVMDQGVAQSIMDSGAEELIRRYVKDLKRIVIPAARVREISTDTWAEVVNPSHLERLSGFLDVLMIGGGRFEEVLVHTTANLAVGGVLVPDDRLFQRRISAYLNSNAMQGRFLLNYLLLERLPVYFHDIGATNRLRDDSTEIDSWGDDPVLYFLRKQVHVNASNHNVRLLEQIIRAWVENDLSVLRDSLPPDVFDHADGGLIRRYSSVIGPFFSSAGILDAGGLHLDRLISLEEGKIDAVSTARGDNDGEIRAKVRLLCRLYREVVRKYSLLTGVAGGGNAEARLSETAAELRKLKSAVLSPEKTKPQESLYFKRHIAFGIPSVLGSYHEPKFDALAGMLRLAGEVPVLLEEVLSGIKEDGGSGTAGVSSWMAVLNDAWEILKVYGLENGRIDEFIDLISHNRLHLSQIADVLVLWQKELAWIAAALSRTFQEPLVRIIEQIPRDDLPDHLAAAGKQKGFVERAADIVTRDLISSTPGLVETDRLLEAVSSALRSRIASGSDILLGAEDGPPRKEFYVIGELEARAAQILGADLGSKAKNLVHLREQGIRVPVGIVLPANAVRTLHGGGSREQFRRLLREAVARIENQTGRKFGGMTAPLFLSVRSGSYISMPGILATVLYCGMNEDTREAFGRRTGDPELAWDSWRKFLENYGTVVHGLAAETFDHIGSAYRREHSLDPESPLSARHTEAVAGLYENELHARGLAVPADVYDQLQLCILAVLGSWDSERGRQFRAATGVSMHWGTSVTLMEMVSGNREGSGASVFFTRDPSTLEPAAYGETREQASGDDLVSGRRANRPLSRSQEREGQTSLERLDPVLYRLHRDLAGRIEKVFNGLPQEVEVTYTRDREGRRSITVLQARRMEAGETIDTTFDEVCRMESRVIGRGVGARGGAVSGVASFAASADTVRQLAHRTGMPVILLRRTANTDDISLMPVVDGIVTASGGVTSHAAVLAQKFGVSAVVGCRDMKIATDREGHLFAMIGTERVNEGAELSIDGTTGLVFSGTCFSRKA